MTRILGLARCTAFVPSKEDLKPNKTLGPDNGWVLLSENDLQEFCVGEGKDLIHRGKAHYDHVCASFSEWAFDAHDASYIRCVVFLHYNAKRKVASKLGDVDDASGAKIFNITGDELMKKYKAVKFAEKEAHVWKRASHGEIAIDFCLAHGQLAMQ